MVILQKNYKLSLSGALRSLFERWAFWSCAAMSTCVGESTTLRLLGFGFAFLLAWPGFGGDCLVDGDVIIDGDCDLSGLEFPSRGALVVAKGDWLFTLADSSTSCVWGNFAGDFLPPGDLRCKFSGDFSSCWIGGISPSVRNWLSGLAERSTLRNYVSETWLFPLFAAKRYAFEIWDRKSVV